MASITLRPTSASGNSWSNLSNAYDGNSNSYATSPNVTLDNHTNYRATFNFDVSSLTGKTINSATLTVRAEVGFTGEMRLYADINTAGSNRVISTDLISTYSVTNYTANIANYINNLSSVIVTPAQITTYDNNINIYEVWIDVDYTTTTATTYTVRFLDWDNSVISTQTVTSGGSATPPPNPTRDGYTFSGWSGNYTNVTANVDIIAQYTKNSSGGDDTSVKNIKIGNSTIDKLYLGTSQILKAYLGSILLYSYSSGGTGGVEEGLLCELQATNHGTDNSVWKDISGNGNDATIYNYGNNSSDVWSSNFLTIGTGGNSRLQLNDNLCSVMEWTVEFKAHVYENSYTHIQTVFAKRTKWTNNMLFCLYIRGSNFWFECPERIKMDSPSLNDTFNVWKIYCNQSTGQLIIKINDTEYYNNTASFDSISSVGKICFAGVPDTANENLPMDIEYIKFYEGNKL